MNVGYEMDMDHVKTNAIVFGVVIIALAEMVYPCDTCTELAPNRHIREV